jgi:acetolactate synthase-1/2/3 large subunit
MNVSEYVVSELIHRGVTHVFTLPGGYSQYLNDSIHYSSLIPIYMLDERAATFAAAAYAQFTRRLGVCVVTSGPGSTNALTGVASAFQDSLPLLVLSGEAKVPLIEQRERLNLRQGGTQDVNIKALATPITKYAETVMEAKLIQPVLKMAFHCAMTHRKGPAWVAIPLDIQSEKI